VLAKTNGDNTFGVLVMVNCETDFVGKSEDFVNLVTGIANAALENKTETLEAVKALQLDGTTVEEQLSNMTGKTGEKLEFASYAAITAPVVSGYNHLGNKIGTLLGMNKNADGAAEVGHDVAMQIAAMNPVALNKESVPQSVVEKELEIGKELARQEGKPEAMLDRIAEGRLGKFFKENTLMSQDFIKDSKKTVGAYLQETDKDLTVTKFFRFALG
jgi:elongation factor Ts